MIGQRKHSLVLAIYPNTRGFAFSAFEGLLAPVDWGVKEVRGPNRNRRCMAHLKRLASRVEPDVIVLQHMGSARRVRRIKSLNAWIERWAGKQGIMVASYAPAVVQATFGPTSAHTKQECALYIAKHVPAFERYLPPRRKPWMAEDARMGIFDAAALAMAFFKNEATQ